MEKRFDGTDLAAVFGGGLLYLAIRSCVKYIKRECTKIKKQEKQSSANLKKAGVDQTSLNKIKKRVNKYEKNAFVKSCFCGFVDNENFNPKMLYGVDENGVIVDNDSPERTTNLIRVREVADEKGRKTLEFLLEIPCRFDPEIGLNLGDYVRCCDRSASHMWERIVVDCIRPRKKLVGFVGYSRKDPDNPENRIAETVEITSELTMNYKTNPESNHDGLYDFCKFYKKYFDQAESMSTEDGEVYVEPEPILLDFLGFTEEDEVRLFEAYMAYKIPFPEKFYNPKDGRWEGIDVAKVLKCLKYLLTELKIYSKRDEDNNRNFEDIEKYDWFDYVMFQSLDPNGNYNMNYYYDMKGEDVITTHYEYGLG